METKYDLVVIGAGPGGYVSAAAAARKGMKTALIENRQLGGTCLNRGCIPTKTIMHSSELYSSIARCDEAGISCSELSFDMAKIQEHKDEVLETLRTGIAGMMKKNKVDVFHGTGTVISPGTVSVSGEGGETVLETTNILIATGSKPMIPPIPGVDQPGVVSSDELLDSTEIPSSIVIIGGGVIGMEFAAVYNAFGAKVTVIEALDRLLGRLDKEFSQSLKLLAKKRGLEIHTSAMVKEIRKNPDGSLACVFEEKEKLDEAQGDIVLVAAGRAAVTDGLFGPGIEPEVQKGRICIDENYMTSIPGIYAIGDVTGGIQLAHAASAAGLNAVCHMCGESVEKNMNVMPSCVYTDPEIASVGLNADEAKAEGYDIVTAKYPMSANGKSVLSNQGRGFIKIVADAATGTVIGAQMMCARATDMIAVFAEAVACKLTVEQMERVIYPHPTFSEGIGEAVDLLIEKLNKKKSK